MFTKEDFFEIIAAIEKQNEFDLGYAKLLSQVTSVSDVPTYDNSSLTNLLFSLLQRQFPAVDGECEIERYCYALNFGWVDGNRVITYDDLWLALITRKSIDFPLNAHQKEVAAIVSDFYPVNANEEKK